MYRGIQMSATKLLYVGVAVCLLVGLAVPTLAIAVGSDPVSDGVALEPVDDRYATVEDGELTLAMDVVDHARTDVLEVFTISIGEDADDVESVWIEHSVDGVEFYADGSEISSDAPFEPDPGDTITVGVLVDSTITDATSESFTIHVAESDDDPEGASLVDVTVSDTEVELGETITVTGTYEGGDQDESITSSLTVNRVVETQQDLSIESDGTETVTFNRTMDALGEHEVGIDHETETVTVVEPSADENGSETDTDGNESETDTDEPFANLVVSNASLADDAIEPGESTTATATVTNEGNATGERTLRFAVGGFVVESTTVELEPGEQRAVSFDRQFDRTGTYAVTISGESAGTLTVAQSANVPVNVSIPSTSSVALATPLTLGFAFVVHRRWRRVYLGS